MSVLRGWNLRWSVDSVPTSLAVYWGQDMVKHGLAAGQAGRRIRVQLAVKRAVARQLHDDAGLARHGPPAYRGACPGHRRPPGTGHDREGGAAPARAQPFARFLAARMIWLAI